MLNYLLVLLAIDGVLSAPLDQSDICCIDHKNKDLEFINYDCSQLTSFGKERCKTVHSGEVCMWKTGRKCLNLQKKCNRISHYTTHFNVNIDTGLCSGLCKENTCVPAEYSFAEVNSDGKVNMLDAFQAHGNIVKIIKSCHCNECAAKKLNKVIEVPVGKCEGNCQSFQNNKVCESGIVDSFDSTNGNEPSQPSQLLINGILNGCSAGIQSGYDIFMNNRCFGHTFTNCFVETKCPLKSATLDVCMRAANVPLTNTDSLILGTNGVGIWSKSLVNLNGAWNPGDTLCTTLDLNNLPVDGVSVLNQVQSIGHLDVVVQDDTAVDYLNLRLNYEECERCIPTSTSISTLYQPNNILEFTSIEKCDCVNMSNCHREELLVTHYPGTLFETIVDAGQCVGRCPSFNRCRPKDFSTGLIKSPHGTKEVTKIKTCGCSTIAWNGLAKL